MATVSEIYRKAVDNGVLSNKVSEERFAQMLQNDNERKAYWEFANQKKPKFYSEDYNVFSQNASALFANNGEQEESGNIIQRTYGVGGGASAFVPTIATGLNAAQQKEESRKEQLQREKSATLPITDEDKQREEEISRLATEGAFGKPNGVTYSIDKTTGMPVFTKTNGDGLHLNTGINSNQSEIDRLKSERPSYMQRKIESDRDIVANIFDAWTANTDAGRQDLTDTQKYVDDIRLGYQQQFDQSDKGKEIVSKYQQEYQNSFDAQYGNKIKQFSSLYQDEFKQSSAAKDIISQYKSGKLTERQTNDALKKAFQDIYSAKYSQDVKRLQEEFDKTDTAKDINSRMNDEYSKAFNAAYGEQYEKDYNEAFDGLTKRAIEANKDYYEGRQRELHHKIANNMIGDTQKIIDAAEKELKPEGFFGNMSRSVITDPMYGYGNSPAGEDDDIRAAKNFIYKAKQRMADMSADSYKFGDFTKNVGYDLGGILESTISFGLSDVRDRAAITHILEKVNSAASKSTNPDDILEHPETVLSSKERAVYDAYCTMLAAELARSTDTSYLASAAELTAQMIPFMIDVGMMNGIFGGLNRAAQQGIARGMSRSIISKLPKGTVRRTSKLTGLTMSAANTAMYAVEAGATALALPRTYANMLQNKIDAADGGTDIVDGKLVIKDFDINTNADAFLKAWRDQWKELFTEVGGAFNIVDNILLKNPLTRKTFNSIKKTELGKLIDTFSSGKYFEYARQMGYQGIYKEWKEEVEGTCWDYIFGDKDAFSKFFTKDTQIPMIISFSVPAVIGGGVNAANELKYKYQYKSSIKKIQDILKQHGYTDEDFADIKNKLYTIPLEDFPQEVISMASAITNKEQFGNMYKDYARLTKKKETVGLSDEEQQILDAATQYLFNSEQTAESRELASELTRLAYAEVALASIDSDIAHERSHAINKARGFYDEVIQEQEEEKAQKEAQQVTEPVSKAASERERISNKVKQTVHDLAFRNGGELTDDTPIYRVQYSGDPNKQGYVVSGEASPVIEQNSEGRPIFTNDAQVTVKWDDDTISQLTLKDLQLLEVSRTDDRITSETEARMNEVILQRIQNGEEPILMQNANGQLQGFFPTDDGMLEDPNTGDLFTLDQLVDQGWIETKHVVFTNGEQVVTTLDNGDGTYTPLDAMGNTTGVPMTEQDYNNQGLVLVPFNENEESRFDALRRYIDNNKKQGPPPPPAAPAPVMKQEETPKENVQVVEPIVPNVNTMSADEFGARTVEYLGGDRNTANAYINAELDKAKAAAAKINKQQVRNYTDIADFKRQNDELNAQKKAANQLVSRLEGALLAAANYKTEAERQAEAERKAREAAMREQRRQLDEIAADETRKERWNKIKKTIGRRATKTLPNGRAVHGYFVMHEAEDSYPSHDPRNNFASNPGYILPNGSNVNDNNYKDPEVIKTTMSIAQNYGGQALENIPMLEKEEGKSLNGNGRNIAAIIAAINNTDQAYIEALRGNLDMYGFTEKQMEEYRHPHVDFVIEDDLPFNTATFAMFNQQEKKTKSSVNRAVANSKMVTEAVRDKMLEIMDQYESLDSFFGSEIAAGDVIQSLIQEGLMTQQEVAGLTEITDRGYKFNQSGKEYVTDMLLGTLFDEETIRMLAGEKTLKQAILRALPSIVENRRLKGYELTGSINNAIKLLYEARKANEGKSTADAFQLYLRQVDAFEGKVVDRYDKFDVTLAYRMSAGVEQLRDLLGLYNNSARSEANGQMGFFAPRTPEEIKNDIYDYYAKQQPEFAAALNGGAAEGTQLESAVPSGTTDAGEVRQEGTAGEQVSLIELAKREDIYDKYPAREEKPAEKKKPTAAERAESAQLVAGYLNTISSKETKGVLFDNDSAVALLKSLHVDPEIIKGVEEAVNAGDDVGLSGFYLNGVVYLNIDALDDPDTARSRYVHERQHGFTLQDLHWVDEVMKVATADELTPILQKLNGGAKYYDNKEHLEKADEFISFAMEVAYDVSNDAELEAMLKEAGVKDELINIIKSINDEQRQSDDLSRARRTPYVDERNAGDSQQNGRDRGTQQKRGLEPEGSRPVESSKRGTEGSQVTPFKDTLLGRVVADFKKQHPDENVAILFREGDTYEIYDEDAVKAGQILGLEPTTKDGVPFLSFPKDSLKSYLGQLVRGGLKIGISSKPDHKPSKGDYQIGDKFTYNGKTATIKDFTYFDTAILDVDGNRVEVSRDRLDDILDYGDYMYHVGEVVEYKGKRAQIVEFASGDPVIQVEGESEPRYVSFSDIKRIPKNQQQETKRPQTDAAEVETGGALVDQLERMGVEVSTDLAANQEALKKAKKDNSEAGTIHYYKTRSGRQYGFSYKGKVYLDPRKVDANLPLHEYGHLWCDAFRRLNPEGWQSVIETIKADADSWNFIKQLRPELKNDDEIADEVIATFSGKRGSEKLKAELERMAGKDPNYKPKWQNIFKNISKAIQDFWKAVGDFLHIQYTSAEQVYDQVLKDFVENMNPRKRIEAFLKERNDAYLRAVEANDSETATAIFNEALRENIGNGITPYVSVGNYNQLKRLAKGVKTRDPKIIQEAAELIAPLIPENAVLIPAPSHTGRATDMLDLANAIAAITPAEVADILQSAPRTSQYQQKKETGVPMSSKNLGITLNGVVPEGKVPVVIDNVVDSGNTAEACVQAIGKGVVVSLANSAPAYGHAATLKSASPVLRDKNGNVIPLDQRFDVDGSRYLGKIAPQDVRFSINGTGLVHVDDKTLIGLHNLSEEKLRKAMKMGGLANPSAAVIDLAKQNHHGYGEVSLVMPSSLVESESGRNAGTYAGDAYTPMYPNVEYRAGKETAKRLDELTKGLPEDLAFTIQNNVRDYMDKNRNYSGLEYVYLAQQGRELPIELTPRRYPYISIEDIYKRLGMEYPGFHDSSSYDAYEKLEGEQLAEFNLWLEQYGDQEKIDKRKEMVARMRSEGKDGAANYMEDRLGEHWSFAAYDSALYRIMQDGRDAGKENYGRTIEKAQTVIDTEGMRPAFETWLQKEINKLGYNEVIFAGWTRDGDRRYLPNTIENASRLMNKEGDTNWREGAGVSETKSMLIPKFRTLNQIRKHKDILESDKEKIKTAYEEVGHDWTSLGIDFRDYTQKDGHAYGLDDNPYIAVDNALMRIQEAMMKADPIAYLNREYRYQIPADNEWAGRIAEMKERIANLPSRYFETKFRRPVYLNEFAAAVVPNDLSQDLRDGLQNSGLTLFDYDPSTAGSRRDATLKATEADGIRFSISGKSKWNTTPAAEREMTDIKDRAIKDGTFMQAPNGKPSRLNERQWLQVRTNNFKRWFGDWENNPQNASKILDENGEPRVVYHGRSPIATFTEFRESPFGKLGAGIYFTPDRSSAEFYSRRYGAEYGNENVIEAFLNMRNPLYTKGEFLSDAERAELEKHDGVIFQYYGDIIEINAHTSNQIKSATNNDGDFSEENDDIRFSISNQNNDIFYSNAERAVEGIKQEKATPEQWKAMIEKNGGLKAGEDKWIGLSDWLAQQRPTVTPQANETRSQFVERASAENKRFTLNKQDLLDYIREHKIQIEETHYQEEVLNGSDVLDLRDEIYDKAYDLMSEARDRFYDMDNEEESMQEAYEYAMGELKADYGDDVEYYYNIDISGYSFSIVRTGTDRDFYEFALNYYHDVNNDEVDTDKEYSPINSTRLRYTTEGLENKREIALTIPTIESWGRGDDIHFGDAGEGRAIAWVRFGDAYAKGDAIIEQQKLFRELSKKYNYPPYALREKASKEDIERLDAVEAKINEEYKTNGYGKVLVIDEIQSKRHQEGREKGYADKSIEDKYRELNNRATRLDQEFNKFRNEKDKEYGYDLWYLAGDEDAIAKYGSKSFDFSKVKSEDVVKFNELNKARHEADREEEQYRPIAAQNAHKVDAAPFEKNWHELAMKRILRFAAENGYDKVAWTTGKQQADRYDIGKEIDHIVKTDDYSYEVYPTSGLMMSLDFDKDGIYRDEDDREYNGKSMSDIFGKELAKRLQEMPVDETLQGDGLRVGYDGMKGFYDDMLPRFMQKYGKKWGATVGYVTMPDLEEGYQTMHSVDITDDMRRSVLEGQPMFSISGSIPSGDTMAQKPNETRMSYFRRVSKEIKSQTPKNTSLDEAIRFSITVNHNSPYLLKKADGSFVDPETGERLGFDHRFMGKGEGGQAHGWGSYFSVNDIRSYGEGYGFSLRDIKDAFNTSRWQSFGVGDAFDVAKGYLLEAHSEKAPSLRKWLEDRLAQKQELLKSYEGKVANTAEEDLMVFRAEADVQYIPALLSDMVNDIDTRNRHHYSVDIPDNTGENYLEEGEDITNEQSIKIGEQAIKEKLHARLEGLSPIEAFKTLMIHGTTDGRSVYEALKFYTGGNILEDKAKRTSKFLNRAGFVGIHYDGHRDGECYVIFDENDAKITDHIRFSISGKKTPAHVEDELERDGFSDESPIRFSIAYHGTGADFDKFLKSKINTGEGSQAFGWGLYFTDAKEIAEDYAKRQARQPKNARDAYFNDQPLDYKDPKTDMDCVAWALNMLDLRNIRTMNADSAKSILNNSLLLKIRETADKLAFYTKNGATEMANNLQEQLSYYKRAHQLVKEGGLPSIEFRGDRNLYTVSIPEDEGNNYFEWNADISDKLKGQIIDGIVRRMEQKPDYANHLPAGYAANIVNEFMKPYHVGGVVYLVGTRWLEREDMSDILSEIGYKGIKYDAGTNFSTGVPDGAKNYVIFNDDDIQITEHIRFAITKNPKPVGYGDFGDIYDQFKGKPQEAIAFLMKKKGGEALEALSHKNIGPIDLVWGEEGTGNSDGFGLAKLAKYHPEVVERLQEVLDDMHVTSRSSNRIKLESDKYFAVVRLTWNDQRKTWLLTAFEKQNSVLDNTTDTGETLSGKQNDTATLQNTVSDRKGTTNISHTQENSEFFDENIRFSIRKEPTPAKTGIGYKVFYRGKDGKLYPPMVANPNGEDTPVNVWLNADAAPVAGESKTGRPQVKAGGKGTQGGSGQLAYRPGWHLGEIPFALQFNRKDKNGEKTLFPKDFVWAEVEYAADKDYQKEAESYGVTENGKYRHSYAGLPRIPKDGFYMYRTNPNPDTDPWIITGAMKVNRVLTNEEVDDMVRAAGREPQLREGDTNNDIRFAITSTSGQNKNRSEVITEVLVKQANNNYGIMQAALKKVTQDLKGIRAAMRMQSDYDRKVVDSLLNLYNTLLQENGVWAQYMPDTTRRIATQIVHAIGKQNITEEVNTIMDHMVHAQAKAAQRQWDKLRQTPIDKINISGVVMQGKVALEGQHALKALNEVLDPENGITLLTLRGDHTDPNKEVDGLIDQLMQMEDNATDESQKLQYKGQWIGYEIAAQYLERIQHIQEERKQLDLELKKAQGNMALKPAARKQLVESIKQAMRDNYLDQTDAYMQSTRDLQEYVSTQEVRAKDFIRRQDANRDKIRSYAQRDLEGLATNPNRNRTRTSVLRSIWDAFASPIRDLQSLLRLTGLHAPDGEGYLYNHFMRNWMDGADKERTGIVAASKTLDEKIAELTHGKYKTWEKAARKINDASHNMFGITMLNGVDGKDMPVTEEIPLNAGNALYIYAVNKMNDGRMKLNGMNITEEDVQALADKVREQFGQEILDVVDWVQSEFFSQLRNRYNPTHEALFGAPMDAIENYFPLRINAAARQQNEDLSEPDTDAARLLAGTSTGAIKRRTRNSLPLDVRNADFFQEVIRHISQMERWNAFAQWNRDANILFSDINFRNRIKGMKGTIYGSGDKLYNYMKDAFRVAIGTYKPKTDTFSEITLNIAKGVTSAKINFRTFTALKQIASFPAFFTYMQDGVFVGSYLRNWLKPHETMKWAKENLPNFEKRISKRDMGDMRLIQRSTDWQWNKRILEWSSKYGMFFNVYFDTLTCATGARAVFDSHLADYIQKGYNQEDARNRARQDAEQAFNTSQQSSDGAFMSAVQQDRNLVTAALTVFRTSPIQYTRNFFYHTRNLLRKFGEGKRDEQIAFRIGQYKNDGLNEEQARKAAEKDYNKSLRQDIVGFVVYGALLNILWRLVGQAPYLFFGDDDDKKKEILEDATTGGALVSPITGLLGGGIIESALDGNGSVADMFAPEMPFTQDVKRACQYQQNDKYAGFASQALSVLMQSGTGFDPLTAADMITRVVTTLDSEQDLTAAEQALRISQALLSIPQSQYEQMLIDNVVENRREYRDALKDYQRYKAVHTAPLTWWMRSDEAEQEADDRAKSSFDKLIKERKELKK